MITLVTEDLEFIGIRVFLTFFFFFLEGIECRFQTSAHLDFLLQNSIFIGKWG